MGEHDDSPSMRSLWIITNLDRWITNGLTVIVFIFYFVGCIAGCKYNILFFALPIASFLLYYWITCFVTHQSEKGFVSKKQLLYNYYSWFVNRGIGMIIFSTIPLGLLIFTSFSQLHIIITLSWYLILVVTIAYYAIKMVKLSPDITE